MKCIISKVGIVKVFAIKYVDDKILGGESTFV